MAEPGDGDIIKMKFFVKYGLLTLLGVCVKSQMLFCICFFHKEIIWQKISNKLLKNIDICNMMCYTVSKSI